MTFYQTLLMRIRMVRRKWRLQAVVQGAALFLASTVALLVLGVFGADLFGFKPAAVWAVRAAAGALVLLGALRFLYLPWRRRVTDVQVAQFIEETYPQLQDRLVTAVEFGQNGKASPGILALLIRDTLQKVRPLDLSIFLNARRLAMYAALGVGASLFLGIMLSWGPSYFPYGFDRLYVPWSQASGNSTLLIEVRPGDVQVNEGSDQEIEARLVGFTSADARLMLQTEGQSSWQQQPMEPAQREARFLHLLVDVQSSLRYYVEAGGIRSPSYTVSVRSLAHVDKIDAVYHFPAYTGMESQVVEDEGNLSGLKGTRVELNVHLTRGAESARLLFDDQTAAPLNRAGELAFSGTVRLERTGSYVVQLADAHGAYYTASREYDIAAVEDEPPRVSITRPFKDLRATNVEEVFAEVSAADDIGVGSLQLRFSVNGDAEQTVGLYSGKPPQTSITAAHTFFLEEFSLQPGDLVSYYASVTDTNDVTGPGRASSDIYFIQVRPFENRYVQSQQGGQPGGGEGGEGQNSLSRQQKDIIAATFKLIRDRAALDPKEIEDSLNALALVQSRLQAQAQGVVDRMTRRGASEANDDFARLTEYLRSAIAEMQKAAVHLGAQKPAEALPEEQKALQQLMRAESLFQEIQISLGSGGSGEGGSRAEAEDLADLFELELNKLKNQYETVQRGERQQRDQKLDEAMERLKELAQRQQQLNERNRMLGQRGGSSAGSSGGGGQAQQQVMNEADQLARQLQRLSRERSSPELNRVSSQLQRAIQEMKQSLQNQQAGRDASGQGIRALQQLEEAKRALSRQQSAGLGQGLENALQESRQLLEEQEKIQAGIDRVLKSAGAKTGGDRQLAEDLAARKGIQAERLKNLQGSIQDLAREARKAQPETSAKLNDAAGTIRDRRLPERILSGGRMLQGGYLEALSAREEYVRAGLDEVRRQLEDAKNSIGETKEGRLADALDRTRRLAEGLESMQRRLQGLPRGQGQQRSPGKQQPGKEGAAGSGPKSAQERASGGTGGQGSQAGRQAGAQPGTNDARGLSQGAVGPPTGIGPYTDEEIRQLSRERQQRLADAGELRQFLDRNATQMQYLEDVIGQLRKMDEARQYNDPAEISALQEAVQLLRQIEMDLSRELAQLTQKERFLYGEDNEAPSGYRKLVEEYYKALARGKP